LDNVVHAPEYSTGQPALQIVIFDLWGAPQKRVTAFDLRNMVVLLELQ